MARFASTKAALGHLAAFMRGPKLAQLPHDQVVHAEASPDDSDEMALLVITSSVAGHVGIRPDALLEWAQVSDGVVTVDGKLGAALHFLRCELEAAGLVDKRVEPAAAAPHWWQDLNTGEWHRTMRAKQ